LTKETWVGLNFFATLWNRLNELLVFIVRWHKGTSSAIIGPIKKIQMNQHKKTKNHTKNRKNQQKAQHIGFDVLNIDQLYVSFSVWCYLLIVWWIDLSSSSISFFTI
jgi:hypothetical protein